MNHTFRHIVSGLVWLLGLPLLGALMFALDVIPAGEFHSTLLSAVWALGTIAIFYSWAWRDAKTHGRSGYVAVGFTALWLLIFFFAVFPYLFVTRGLQNGLITSLKFFSLIMLVAISVFALAAISRLIGW